MEQYGKDKGQKQFIIRADMNAVMDFIGRELRTQDVVVMVSGDPGYYSMLDAVRRHFEDKPIKVIPGLSSMQVAFAKLGMPWQEAEPKRRKTGGWLPSCFELRQSFLLFSGSRSPYGSISVKLP